MGIVGLKGDLLKWRSGQVQISDSEPPTETQVVWAPPHPTPKPGFASPASPGGGFARAPRRDRLPGAPMSSRPSPPAAPSWRAW